MTQRNRGISEPGALRVVDRHAWAAKIRKVLAENNGRIPEAADALGVSKRQLFRWVAEIEEVEGRPVPRSPTGVRRDRKAREVGS